MKGNGEMHSREDLNPTKGLNPTARDLRRINRRTVVQALFTSEAASRFEVSQRSGLSAGTVTNVVSELLAEGIVLEAGFEVSEQGRRRAILTLNRDYGYILGGEIGETGVSVGLFDLRLHRLTTFRSPLSSEENNPTEVVNRIIEGVAFILQKEQITPDKILGMGLGLPGIVEHTEEQLVSAPAWGWEPVPLKEMLARHFPFPLHLDNGAKAMALAEIDRNPQFAKEIVVSVYLGTGVGAGIIHEGKLNRGSTNSAGEWGHTIIVVDGEACRCGHLGCLEAYVGSLGIIRRLHELDATHPALQMRDEFGIIHTLIHMASRDDMVAKQVLDGTIRYLAAGLANLINLCNPHRIILSGMVGLELGQFALAEIRKATRQYALKLPCEAAEISVSQLEPDGASIGMAKLVLDDFFDAVGGKKTHPSLYPSRL
jgi:predicted NBD/HSP70 family sugar kinase